MAIVFSDDFNRADAPTLGTKWTLGGENSVAARIASNRARIWTTGINFPETAMANSTAHGAIADQKVQVTQVATGSDGGPVARVVASTIVANGTNPNLYGLDSYGTVCEIYRQDTGGTAGALLRTGTVTKVANAVLRLEVTGTGATVTLKQFYNGTQVGADASDGTASRITTAGQSGIYAWQPADTTTWDWDDFSVDDFTVAGPSLFVPSKKIRPFPFKPSGPPRRW
jgi:hypothetical protein